MFGRLSAGTRPRLERAFRRRAWGAYHPAVARIEVIRPFVEETVAKYLGIPREQLKTLEDGTIPIRAGSTAVSVRLMEGKDDHPILQVFAVMLRDVDPSPGLLEKLNEMNGTFTFARVCWIDRQVIIATELLAEDLDHAQVEHACGLISWAGDRWDGELRSTYGGEVAFPDAEQAVAPAPPPAEAAKTGVPAAPPAPPKTGDGGGPDVEEPPAAGYI